MATAPNREAALPPFIHPDDMPDQYAVTGTGHCLAPVITHGTLIVFDKRPQPEPGNFVGLWFTREAALQWGVPGIIKRLEMRLPPKGFDGLIVVEQLNPPRQYVIPTTDILAVHKAIGTAESKGDGQAQWRPSKAEAWA